MCVSVGYVFLCGMSECFPGAVDGCLTRRDTGWFLYGF